MTAAWRADVTGELLGMSPDGDKYFSDGSRSAMSLTSDFAASRLGLAAAGATKRERVMEKRPRDSAQTRERILRAARKEFATLGFSGARVDAIAERAECDKRLLYRYFKDKAGLFDAAMVATLSCGGDAVGDLSGDLGESFERQYPEVGEDAEWLRTILWESLEGEAPVAGDERKARFREAKEAFRALQESGEVGSDVDPAMGALVMAALLVFPWVMPQFVRIACGRSPRDPSFRSRYVATVRRILAAGVGPRPRASAPVEAEGRGASRARSPKTRR